MTFRGARGGSSQKINIEGGLLKKGGLGQFANLKGGGGLTRKRGGGAFEGWMKGVVDTPMHTMTSLIRSGSDRKIL